MQKQKIKPEKKKKLEFKLKLEDKDENEQKKVRMVFHFKNNTDEDIFVESYHNTTYFDEKIVKRTSPSEELPHPCGKIIKPSMDWQPIYYDWVNPEYYGINKNGNYNFHMIIKYIYKNKKYKTQDFLNYNWSSKKILNEKHTESKKAVYKKPKWETIFDEIIDVPSGDHKPLEFDFEKGDKIRGIATEIDDYKFDCYIVNKSEYARYRNDEQFDALETYYDVSSVPFEFEIPEDDIWYFVFDSYMKQYDREIEVKLRKKSA